MITIRTEISVGDLLMAVLLLLTAIGLFLTLIQMKNNERQKRAEFLIDLYKHLISDNDMMDIYYKIEYGEFQYSEKIHNSPDEIKLDKLLGLFENIARLYFMKNITMNDLEVFSYMFLVVYENESVKQYFQALDEEFDKRVEVVKSYELFRKVCEEDLKEWIESRKQKMKSPDVPQNFLFHKTTT
jgi:hypothetical protein